MTRPASWSEQRSMTLHRTPRDVFDLLSPHFRKLFLMLTFLLHSHLGLPASANSSDERGICQFQGSWVLFVSCCCQCYQLCAAAVRQSSPH